MIPPDAFLRGYYRYTIGYDYHGNKTNSDQKIVVDNQTVTTVQAPPHPIFPSAFLQDKIEFGDLVSKPRFAI